MRGSLIETLSRIGKPPCVFPTGDGTELLILPHGGRILGLFAASDEENFYWTHPALRDASSAADFFASDAWHNSGGDRTWLAPEVDFFFPDYPRTENYWQPRQLDPGIWTVTQTRNAVRLTNRLTCRLSRSQVDVEMEITREARAAANPLRFERWFAKLAHVEYAGYELESSLELVSGEGRVGLWDLIQMPHGGDLMIATYGRTEPRVFFGVPGEGDIEVREGMVLHHMRAEGEHKTAVRALAATGRIAYRYRTAENRCRLIVRNVFVNPSGAYDDVPWTDPDDRGYAIQACNVHSALGHFAELEYHVPAIGQGTGQRACRDVCQTWAFHGTDGEINEIASHLLAREPIQ